MPNSPLTGRNFDPFAYAVGQGVTIRWSDTAPLGGCCDPDTRIIHLPTGRHPDADRSALALQLGWIVLPTPTPLAVWRWAADRLAPREDLDALATVTDSPAVWARALRISPLFLSAYLALEACIQPKVA